MTENTHDLKATYKANISALKDLELIGDGSLSPKLRIKLYDRWMDSYVDAYELRRIAKTLKKWAKGLEQHETLD